GVICPGRSSGAPLRSVLSVFFFQAEDGIRDPLVTGVQTCALPICGRSPPARPLARGRRAPATSGRGLRGPGGAGRRGRAASAGTPRGPAPAPPRRPRLGPAGSRRRLTAPGGHRLAVDVVLGGSPRDEDLLSTARAGADEVHLAPSHDPLGGAPALVDDIREAVRVVGIFEVFRGERHWLACLVAVAAS